MVSHKLVRRLLQEDGLPRPTLSKLKRARPADGSVRRHQAQYPHQVWAMDFQFEANADGRRLKFLNAIYEYSRLFLAIRVGRHFNAKDLVSVLDEPLSNAGVHSQRQLPESIAYSLRTWCTTSGIATAYIEPGSPWQNGLAEPLNGRFRDEFGNTELLATVAETQGLASHWRWEYNTLRLYSALQGPKPLETAQVAPA